MIVTAAQPAAAVRFARGAARRHAVRAVQVLLFVGGLVVLGFVLGGQAHAAEQPAASTSLDGMARTEPVGQVRDAAEPVAERVAAAPVAKQVTGPDVESVVMPFVDTVDSIGGAIAERVVEPVGEPVEQVVEGAVQGAAQAVPVQPLPGRPLPAQGWPSPTWPGDGLGVSFPVPAQDQPQGSAPGAVHCDEPHCDEPAADASEHTRASTHAHTQVHPHVYVHRAPDSYMTAASGSPFGGRLPLLPGQSPTGPGGGAVIQSVGDGHTQRGGDPHGAWFSQAKAFGLVPGSLQPATGTAVRERHRDILEFPG